MADNYLEKKMEEHRSGKANRPAVRRTPTGAKPGTINVKFPVRRVFVTGGARGIGRAIVAAFCNAGCRVAFCDIDHKAGTATAQATGSQFHPVDVTDAVALDACVQRVIDAWGDIDVLINNVGVGNFGALTETSIQDFDTVIATNLRPVFITSRRLAIHRQSLAEPNPFGRIINICSTRYKQSEPGTEGYAASKGGIDALTHSLMASLAPMHITVNAISPGWIENNNYDSLTEADHVQHPSQRVGRPEDIARMCMFLALPDNDFINGQNIVIDGGMTRKMIYVE
jgi:NAD(P)-dependent dehydrogenase (short-subunit alcohol dehydrogenase family)